MEVIVECSALASINGEEKDESGYTKPERVLKFLVSFMVDARGGAMRGCRHSGVRVIIPPRKAAMPTRITCRYLKKEKLIHPPPLMEGEACASRILEMGPSGAKFLGPVIIEVPHFASLRGKEREITILRSDNGENWREHTLEATEEAVQEVLNESFDGEELSALEDLNTNRITRILTTDFPQYFAVVSRVRQEVHAIGPEGGMVSSTVVPQVQAVFPEGALTKKIKVGLQAQPIPAELVAKMLGNRVAVSPIVTVEPRRRKFHKPIVLTIPVPQAASKGMLNQYSGDAPTLRLLCSITGGTTRAQWEDVTGSTPLSFVNDCVSFTTTVSARFWLMDCRNISEATKMATELYREAIHVPFMAKFVVFAKRSDPQEARLRVFCMTDDKEEKTLENQEHFVEVAKSRDVEVLETKLQYVEFAGNLVPVTKSGEQLSLSFHAFKENRLPFIVRVRDPHQDPAGRIAFMREPKVGRGDPPQTPICNLNIALPDIIKTDSPQEGDLISIEKRYDYLTDVGLNKEAIHRAELRLSDIATLLGKDWTKLALQLEIAESDINIIKSDCPDDIVQQAIVMLRLWVQLSGNKATGNTLEKALRKINREDIVNQCIFNVELVTDDVEKAVAKVHLDQSGFDTLKEELGPSREASLRRDLSLDASFDEQDIMKEAESAEETSSDAGSLSERRLSGGPDVMESEIPMKTPKVTSVAAEKGIITVDQLEALAIKDTDMYEVKEDVSKPKVIRTSPEVAVLEQQIGMVPQLILEDTTFERELVKIHEVMKEMTITSPSKITALDESVKQNKKDAEHEFSEDEYASREVVILEAKELIDSTKGKVTIKQSKIITAVSPEKTFIKEEEEFEISEAVAIPEVERIEIKEDEFLTKDQLEMAITKDEEVHFAKKIQDVPVKVVDQMKEGRVEDYAFIQEIATESIFTDKQKPMLSLSENEEVVGLVTEFASSHVGKAIAQPEESLTKGAVSEPELKQHEQDAQGEEIVKVIGEVHVIEEADEVLMKVVDKVGDILEVKDVSEKQIVPENVLITKPKLDISPSEDEEIVELVAKFASSFVDTVSIEPDGSFLEAAPDEAEVEEQKVAVHEDEITKTTITQECASKTYDEQETKIGVKDITVKERVTEDALTVEAEQRIAAIEGDEIREPKELHAESKEVQAEHTVKLQQLKKLDMEMQKGKEQKDVDALESMDTFEEFTEEQFDILSSKPNLGKLEPQFSEDDDYDLDKKFREISSDAFDYREPKLIPQYSEDLSAPEIIEVNWKEPLPSAAAAAVENGIFPEPASVQFEEVHEDIVREIEDDTVVHVAEPVVTDDRVEIKLIEPSEVQGIQPVVVYAEPEAEARQPVIEAESLSDAEAREFPLAPATLEHIHIDESVKDEEESIPIDGKHKEIDAAITLGSEAVFITESVPVALSDETKIAEDQVEPDVWTRQEAKIVQEVMKDTGQVSDALQIETSVQPSADYAQGDLPTPKTIKTPPPSPFEEEVKDGKPVTLIHPPEVIPLSAVTSMTKEVISEDGTKSIFTTVVRKTTTTSQQLLKDDGLETARLAESETWTSQELDRSTPDLLHAGPDVITHGPTDEERSWQDVEDQEWDVKKEEWEEKDESGLVTKKVAKIQYSTNDGDADSTALSGKIEETKGAPAAAESRLESSSSGEDKDEGVVEESIPFHQKKDFFQKLATSQEGGVTSPPRKTSPPSPPSEGKYTPPKKISPISPPPVKEKPSPDKITAAQISSEKTSIASVKIAESQSVRTNDEEFVSFSERLLGFKKLEESISESKEKPMPTKVEKSYVESRTVIPKEKFSTPPIPPCISTTVTSIAHEELPAIVSKEARLPEIERQLPESIAKSESVKSEQIYIEHEEMQKVFEGSLNLTSEIPRTDASDDFTITTPDLETPIEGPEAASKSKDQKMIEVTERVAEVASTLASTLEKVEQSAVRSSKKPVVQIPKKDSKETIPMELMDEIEKSAEKPVEIPEKEQEPRRMDIATKAAVVQKDAEIGKLVNEEDKWVAIDSEIRGAFDETEAMALDLVKAKPSKKDQQRIPKTGVDFTPDVEFSEQPVWEPSQQNVQEIPRKPPEELPPAVEGKSEERAVKAEVKLLVKTTEMGRDAIEIRSIREFVEPEMKKSEMSRIFSEAAASDISPPIAKTEVCAEKIAVVPAAISLLPEEKAAVSPSQDHMDIIRPPLLPVEPCLGSLSIAYEEPPRYHQEVVSVKDKPKESITEPLQPPPSAQEMIPDIMQQFAEDSSIKDDDAELNGHHHYRQQIPSGLPLQEQSAVQKITESTMKTSPTDESVDDRAQMVDNIMSDMAQELADKTGKLDVELSEVRTEDEAPEIEDFIVSPMSEHRALVDDKSDGSKMSDDVRQDFGPKDKEWAPSKEVYEEYKKMVTRPLDEQRSGRIIDTSEHPYTNGETETRHDAHRPMILDIQNQSSLEVEVGSRESDECIFSEDDNKLDNSESRMELLMRSFAKDLSDIISATPVGGLPDITEEESLHEIQIRADEDMKPKSFTAGSAPDMTTDIGDSVSDIERIGSDVGDGSVFVDEDLDHGADRVEDHSSIHSEAAISFTEIAQDENLQLSEIESPPIITTPLSERKIFSAKLKPRSPEIRIVEDLSTDGQLESTSFDEQFSQKRRSKDALVTEPTEEEPLIDRRHSSPDFGRLVMQEENDKLKPKGFVNSASPPASPELPVVLIESAVDCTPIRYANGDAHMPEDEKDQNNGVPILHVGKCNSALTGSASSLEISEDGEAWHTVQVISHDEHVSPDVELHSEEEIEEEEDVEDVEGAVWENVTQDSSESTTASDVAMREDMPDEVYEPDHHHDRLVYSQDEVSPADQQAVAEDTDVEDQFTSVTPPHETHIRPPSITETVLSKLSPLEPTSSLSEDQEISPPIEFPSKLSPQSQVYVGISPTEELTTSGPSMDSSDERISLADMPKPDILTQVESPEEVTDRILRQDSSESLSQLPLPPPIPPSPFTPSAPPQPAEDLFDSIVPELTTSELSDRSDTESTQTSAVTVICRPEPDLLSSFRDRDRGEEGTSSYSRLTGLSDRQESLDQEVSGKTESHESSLAFRTTMESSSSMYSSQRTESTESESELSGQVVHLAFENKAFAGVEHIDDMITSRKSSSSPFELTRDGDSSLEDATKGESFKDSLSDRTVQDKITLEEQKMSFQKETYESEIQWDASVQKQVFFEDHKDVEHRIKMELLKEELEHTSVSTSMEDKHIISDSVEDIEGLVSDETEKQERIDQQIRSEIFSHELEEAIEAQQPETKEILSDSTSMDEKAEQFVKRRMKSDIFSQELAQGMDDQSPEQKELPKFPEEKRSLTKEATEEEVAHVVTPTRSAEEIPAETVLWEVPVQEQAVPEAIEMTEEIPAHKQVIVERDEEEEEADKEDEDDESEPETANIEDVERAILQATAQVTSIGSTAVSEKLSAREARQIAEEIVEEIKTEVTRRPPLRHIPSEISEEDLVERYGGSPDQDLIGSDRSVLIKLSQSLHEDKKSKFIATETSSLEITDEELQASSDELSPVEQHRERLESMTIEENLRRQSFVQLSEEHLLNEMEWKASKRHNVSEDDSEPEKVVHELESVSEVKKEFVTEKLEESFHAAEESSTVDKILSEGLVESKEALKQATSYISSSKEHILESQTELKTTTTIFMPSEELVVAKEISTLDKDRERRVKQEQEFQEVIKLRRERAEQARDRSDEFAKKEQKSDDSGSGHGSSEHSLHVTARDKKEPTEGWSSSGESHYYSAVESDSGHTSRGTPGTSRPCSSDVETLVTSGQGSSEYDTCITSEDGTSYRTAPTSQEYVTAASSLSHSSRESMRSIDSESSGHLGSVEISSETSETLVPSAFELERDTETPTIDDDKYVAPEKPVKEPYETEIPEHVIRGERDFGEPFKNKPPIFGLESLYGVKSDRMIKSMESADSTSTVIPSDQQSRVQTDFLGDLDLEAAVGARDAEELESPFELITDTELVELKDTEEATGVVGGIRTPSSSGVTPTNQEFLPTSSMAPAIHALKPSPDTELQAGGMFTSQISDSSFSEIEFLGEGQLRSSMYRQESGAYLAGEIVDDLHDGISTAHDGDDAHSLMLIPTCSGTTTSLTSSILSDHTDVLARSDTSTHTTPMSQSAASIGGLLDDRIGGIPIASAPPAEEDEDDLKQHGLEPFNIIRDQPDVYSQVNGPVEVEFVPEYDAGPDDGYAVLPVATVHRTATPQEQVEITKLDESLIATDIIREEGRVYEEPLPPDVVPVHHQLIVGIPISHRSDVSDEELSDAESDQDVQDIQHIQEVQEIQELQELSEVHSFQQTTATLRDAYQFQRQVEHEETVCSGYTQSKEVTLLEQSFLTRQELDLDRPESELRDLDLGSRPHSHAESDSDQRPYSELQFSDDRPDSELTEIMKQMDISEEKELVSEEIDRPASPEPSEEYEISKEEREDSRSPVVGAVVGEVPLTFSTTVKEELTPPREKHEFETSERSAKEKGMTLLTVVDIPDITVTQHVTPTIDKQYRFLGYEAEEYPDDQQKVSPPVVAQKFPERTQDSKRVTDIPKAPLPETEEVGSSSGSESFEMVEKFDVPESLPEKSSSVVDTVTCKEDDTKSGQSYEYQESTNVEVCRPFTSPVSVKPLGVHYYPADDDVTGGEDDDDDERKDAGSYEKGEFEEQEKESRVSRSEEGSPVPSSTAASLKTGEMDAEKWMEMQFEETESDVRSAGATSGYHYQMNFEREYDDQSEFYPRDEELEDIIEEGEKQDEEEDEKVEFARIKESKSSTPEYDFLAGRKFFSKSGENDDVSMSSLQEFERLEAELSHGDRRLSSDSQDSLNGRRVYSRSGQGDDGSVTSLQEFERLERECADAERVERMSREEAARLSEIEEGHESQASEASQETLSDQGPDDDSDSDDYEKRMFEIDQIIKQAQSNVEQFEIEKVDSAKDGRQVNSQELDKSKVDSGSTESGDATESSLVDKTPSPGDEDEDEPGDAASLDGSNPTEDIAVVDDLPIQIQMILRQQNDQLQQMPSSSTPQADLDEVQQQRSEERISSHFSASSTTTVRTTSGFQHESSNGHNGTGVLIEQQSEPTACHSAQKAADDHDCDRDSLHEDEPIGEKEDDVDSVRGDCPPDPKDDCDSDSLKGELEIGFLISDRGAVGRDFDRDSLAGGRAGSEGKANGKSGGGDTMASSTDSLEPSSSTATHATYQYETDSIMSSSFTSMQTSGEESTMVSSTDTLELEHRTSQGGQSMMTPPDSRFDDGKHMYIEHDGLRHFMDLEGNVQTDQQFRMQTSTDTGVTTTRTFTDTEGNLDTLMTFGDFGTTTATRLGRQTFTTSSHSEGLGPETITDRDPFVRTIHRSVMLEPDVRTVTFAGPDAETKMKEFISKFQPGDDVVEMETTDDMGNVHITRTVQHRVIMKPEITTVNITGPNAEQRLQEYLSNASAADISGFGSRFRDLESELGADAEDSVETEIIETTDEFGNVRRVIQQKRVQPEVKTVSFTGPNAQQEVEEYMRKAIQGFEPGKASEEMVTQDKKGNAMKVIRHEVVTQSKATTETIPHSMTDVPSPHHKAFSKTISTTFTVRSSTDSPIDVGSPRKSPLHRESPPSSPTVSTSSHSEDCYCGPEVEPSTQSASVGPLRPEIEELETESWDPQRRAEFYSEGDFGQEQDYEVGVPSATITGTRVVSHEIRRTIRGPDGEEIIVVETDDSYGQHFDDEELRETETSHKQDG